MQLRINKTHSSKMARLAVLIRQIKLQALVNKAIWLALCCFPIIRSFKWIISPIPLLISIAILFNQI